MAVQVEHWGCLDYPQAHRQQKHYLQEIIAQKRQETILLCSHPPVVTLGKKALANQDTSWSGPIYRVERGGQATYHGPGQVVCYPLIDLKKRGGNLSGLLAALEGAVVETLKEYTVASSGNPERGNPQKTGVWVGEKKIAGLGLAIKSGVSYHGLAFNLHHDPLAFQGINPCGLSPEDMTSLESVLQGEPPCRKTFEERFCQHLLQLLPPEIVLNLPRGMDAY